MAQFILRVDDYREISELYKNNKIKFSCPANWCNYADSQKDNFIGDQLECVFAHLKPDDYRIPDIESLGDTIRRLEDDHDGSYYYQYTPILVTPSFCFFQYDVELEEGNELEMDLNNYSETLGKNDISSLGFLSIYDAKAFEDELYRQVPKAVSSSKNIISDGSGRFVNSFDEDHPINYNNIDYFKYDCDDFYYELTNEHLEMWRKSSRYSFQHEGRITIPHVTFKQEYRDENYCYKLNQLYVDLQNLHNYAELYKGNALSKIVFKKENGKIKICFCR